MSIIGGRWRAVIIDHLLPGKMRFSELRRAIPNISQLMLTLDLRGLEDAGIIARTAYAEVPRAWSIA
jgi:DNA-binding HxlR family transcriptional regulator